MGADIIIAVNVGTPLLKREELDSIFGVAGQMLSILTEQNVQTSLGLLKPTDILISPELGDFSTADFDNLPKIAPLGESLPRAEGGGRGSRSSPCRPTSMPRCASARRWPRRRTCNPSTRSGSTT